MFYCQAHLKYWQFCRSVCWGVAWMEEIRITHRILAGKSEGRKIFWGPSGVNTGPEVGYENVEWIHQAQDGELWWAPVYMVTNPSSHKRYGISWSVEL